MDTNHEPFFFQYKVLPFPLFEVQARVATRLMTRNPKLFFEADPQVENRECGKAADNSLMALRQVRYKGDILSSNEIMQSYKDDVKDFILKGMPRRYYHMLGSMQWAYYSELEELCGLEPLMDWKVLQEIYEDVSRARAKHPHTYRYYCSCSFPSPKTYTFFIY